MNPETQVLSGYCAEMVDQIDPDMFTGVNRAVCLVFQQKGRPSSKAVAEVWLKSAGVNADLSWYDTQPSEKELPDLVDGLNDLSFRRRVVEASNELKKMAQVGKEQLVKEVEQVVSWMMEPMEKGTVKDRDAEAHEWMEQHLDGGGEESGFPSKWSPLMGQVIGPKGPALMLIVAGREGTGKSAWTFCDALDMAEQGAKVRYYSPDMKERKCLARMVSLVSGIPYRKIWNHSKDVPTLNAFEQDKAKAARAYIDLLPLKFDSESDVTKILRWAQIENLDAVYLDFADLFYVPGLPFGGDISQTAARVMAVAHLTRRIANFCFSCLVSQVKTNAEPDAENLGWSRALKDVTDGAIWGVRDENRPLVIFQTVKNRGPAGRVPYYMHGPLMKLIELSHYQGAGGIQIPAWAGG